MAKSTTVNAAASAKAPSRRRTAKPAAPASRQRRTRDADLARETILHVAREHFVSQGLAGARMDEIAAASGYSKAMIYHYFGNKEALYIAILEETYRRDITPRQPMDIAKIGPIAALERFVREGAEGIRKDPSILNLLSMENIHQAEYLKKTGLPGPIYSTLTQQLKIIVDAGVDDGVFRSGIDITHLYLLLSSMIFHAVSNRFTLSVILDVDVASKKFMDGYLDSAVQMIVGFCMKPGKNMP